MRLRFSRGFVLARSAFAALVIAIVLAVAPGIAVADPVGSTAAGGGAGTFGSGLAGTVDTSSGAAVMSVPLEIPVARGIAQPDISLSYNSSRGIGDVALGWNIAPPAIERTGVGGGTPLLDMSDRYVFAGQPLIELGLVQGSACPAAGCTEVMPAWATGMTYFRLQVETTFGRFFRSANGRTWKVQYKDGELWEYGAPLTAANAFVSGDDGGLDSYGSTILRWNLVRKYDVFDGAGPDSLIVYGWKHLHDDRVGVLTDVFDTPPPASGLSDLGQYAHHIRVAYQPYPNQRRWAANPIGFTRMPRSGAVRIDIAVTGAPSQAREHVRSYVLERAVEAPGDIIPPTSDGFPAQRPYLKAVSMQGRCTTPIAETQATDERGNIVWQLPSLGTCPTLAPLTFGYTPFAQSPPSTTQIISPTPEQGGPEPPGGVFAKPALATVVDIDGDGLADIMQAAETSSDSPHIYLNRRNALWTSAFKYNAANYQFVPGHNPLTFLTTESVTAPGLWDFLSPGTFLWRPEANPTYPGNADYHTVRAARTAPFTWSFFESGAPVGAYSGYFLSGDVNNDGVQDIFLRDNTLCLLSRQSTIGQKKIHYSSGPSPNCVTTNAPIDIGPPGSSPAFVTLADVNGDGNLDYVVGAPVSPQSTTFSFHYFPGDGHNRFGCVANNSAGLSLVDPYGGPDNAQCPGVTGHPTALPITKLGGGGDFSAGNNAKFLVGDVTGDGRADILQLRPSQPGYEVILYRNIDGKNFQELWSQTNPDVSFASLARGALADVDGSGISSLVLIYPGSARIYDFHYQAPAYEIAPRPGLLKSVSNVFGAKTTFTYRTAADVEARQVTDSTHPWSSLGRWTRHAPNGLTLVTRLEVENGLPGTYADKRTTDFDYRDAVYDPWRARVLGFARTRVSVLGDINGPDSATDTKYFFDVCPSRDGENSCPYTTEEYAYLGMIGRPVLVEQQGRGTWGGYASWVPLSTTHLHYSKVPLSAGVDGRTSSLVYPDVVDTFLYDEWEPNGSYTVPFSDIDDQSAYPVTVHKASKVSHLRREQVIDKYGNGTSTIDRGRIHDDGSGIDRPIRRLTTPLLISGAPAGGWVWRTSEAITDYAPGGEVVPGGPDPAPLRINFSFDSLGRLTETSALLTGSLPLQRRHESSGAAISTGTGTQATDGTVSLSIFDHDSSGNTIRVRASEGGCADISYSADPYRIHPSSIRNYVAGCGSPGSLLSTFAYDAGLGLRTSITSPAGARTIVAYDGFGRLKTIFGQNPAIELATQTELSVHYLTGAAGPIVHLERAGAQGQDTYIYQDGLGSPFLTLQRANDGDAGEWVASGLSQRNARGMPVYVYQPWFYTGSPTQHPVAVPSTPASYVRHDALGRTVASFRLWSQYPNFYHYYGLKTDIWDSEDLNGLGAHFISKRQVARDGHGRTIQVVENYQSPYYDHRTTDISYTATGDVNGVRMSHFGGGESISRWTRYDSLGRIVENAEPHATENFSANWSSTTGMHAWRYAYDVGGKLVGTSDPRGCGEDLFYDGIGRVTATSTSPCLTSHPPYVPANLETGDGTSTFYKYDEPEPGQTTDFGPSPNVLRGRVTSVRDRATHTRFAYDWRGRGVGTARRIAKPGDASPNLSARYSDHWFRAAPLGYDEYDRPTGFTTGAESPELTAGGSAVTFGYGRRGNIAGIGGSYGALIVGQKLDADGALRERTYGDFAETTETRTYDDLRRVTTRTVQRAAGFWTTGSSGYTPPVDPTTTLQSKLLSDTFEYDFVDNVKRVTDGRTGSEWPSGAKPASRYYQLDDFYRTTRVEYTYPGGADTQMSPFASEEAASSSAPLPRRVLSNRVQLETFQYDWFGSTVGNDDDTATTFDRSLGAIANNNAGGKPGQLVSATRVGGSVGARYDAAGHLIDLQVGRDGSCSAPLQKCFQRFVYDWDELGQLSRARRWDYSTAAQVPTGTPPPVEAPAFDLKYKYGVEGRVVKTTSDGASTVHQVDVFGSLRLVDAEYLTASERYEQNVSTERINLAGVARVVHDPSLPSRSGSPIHVFLEVGDHLGSGAVAFDKNTSELVEATRYSATGKIDYDYRPARWSSQRTDRRFTGKDDEVEVGLSYFGARYFSPHLGRWLSPDPLTVHAGGSDPNPYAYVRGRTHSAIDPFGLADCQGDGCRQAEGEGAAGLIGAVVGGIACWFGGCPRPAPPPHCQDCVGVGKGGSGSHGPQASAPPPRPTLVGREIVANTMMGGGAIAAAVDSLGATAVEGLKPGASLTAKGYAKALTNSAVQMVVASSGATGMVASGFVPQKFAAVTGLAETSALERQSSDATIKSLSVPAMALMCRSAGTDATGAADVVVDTAIEPAEPAAENGPQGWEAFLPEARQRVVDTAARYGNSNAVAMAMSRRDALARLNGLAPQVERHLAKIAAEPTSPAVSHWRAEIRGWLNAMERVTPSLGTKTSAEWDAKIAEWRAQLGE